MYQVLIALIRALRDGGGQALWLAEGIPDREALAQRLRGPFAEISFLYESRWPGIAAGRWRRLAHWRNRRAYEKAGGGPRFQKDAYNTVYICNDWSAVGRYLQDCGASYVLCEDTLGSSIGPDQHLVTDQRADPAFPHQPYLYWGDSPCCAVVESEDASRCILFPPERMVTFSKKALLESLRGEEKEAVRCAFLTEPLPERADGATLLLPRSFVADGLLTQAEQDALFTAVAARYADGPLFIKTHPRDGTDYQALFPEATVLDRRMPSEVLNFCLPFRFKRAVTVQSFVLRGFTAAEETVYLSLEQAKGLIP